METKGIYSLIDGLGMEFTVC